MPRTFLVRESDSSERGSPAAQGPMPTSASRMTLLARISEYFLPTRRREPEGVPESETVPKEPRVFVIGDTHFDHRNILKYNGRPYRTIWGMNRSIIHKWNDTVRPQDQIFFLGDFASPWSNIGYFITRLNGRKTFITGNHDQKLRHTQSSAVIEYLGYRFLLIHNPAHKPPEWSGWTIHGHVHNNDLEKFPYIDRTMKRINVSADVIGFRPVSLHRITETIEMMKQYGHDVVPTRREAAWLRKKAKGAS